MARVVKTKACIPDMERKEERVRIREKKESIRPVYNFYLYYRTGILYLYFFSSFPQLHVHL